MSFWIWRKIAYKQIEVSVGLARILRAASPNVRDRGARRRPRRRTEDNIVVRGLLPRPSILYYSITSTTRETNYQSTAAAFCASGNELPFSFGPSEETLYSNVSPIPTFPRGSWTEREMSVCLMITRRCLTTKVCKEHVRPQLD